MKTLFRWIFRLAALAAVLLVALALILWLLKTRSDQRFYAAYQSEAPLNIRKRPHLTKGKTKQAGAVFDGVDGMPVPLVSFYPAGEMTAPFPCVIFLHGIGQNKTFLELIAPHFTQRGYAIVCFDQYTRGERRLAPGTSSLKKGLAIRRRAALTVMETRRLVDFLQTDSAIASKRIYLVGASFGAMMATIAAAQEPRIAATALIYGGGDWERFADSAILQQEIGPWSTSAAAGAAFLLAPADPVLYAGKLTSRPLLIQNGRRDTIVPVSAAQALIDAAGKQAQVIWYDSDHVGLDEQHVEVVLNDILTWLDQIDRN